MVDLHLAFKKLAGIEGGGENLENICQVCGHNPQRHVGFVDQAKLHVDRGVQLFKHEFPRDVFDGNI